MPPNPPWLQSILEEHFEEIQMLWELRRESVRDPDYVGGDLGDLDERIEANVDALILDRSRSESLLIAGLATGEFSAVFAASFVLLRIGEPTQIGQVFKTLETADNEATLDGLADSLMMSYTSRLEPMLRQLTSDSKKPSVVAVAAEVLAFHGKLELGNTRVAELLLDDSPFVRRRSWRIVSYLGK